MAELTICDLCEQDGEEVKAIGWYVANDSEQYEVCKKHAEDVKTAGFKLHLYEEEDND